MTILKLVSQLLILIVGVLSVTQTQRVSKPETGKKRFTRVGLVRLGMFIACFVVFIATDANERRQNTQKDTKQEKAIAELERLNQQLKQVTFNRDLREIQISFEPSPAQSAKIATAYQKIKSPVPEVPYSAATIKAERIDDHWKIDFDPVTRQEGLVRFAPLSSNQPNGKGFEEILRQASIALWIKWGAGGETELEPIRNQFPSAITVSENAITLVLRPPLITLNLNYLNTDPTFILRGQGDIKSLRFRSNDPGVSVDQTIQLNWKEDAGSDQDVYSYIKKTKPFLSGPHRLQIDLKTVP